MTFGLGSRRSIRLSYTNLAVSPVSRLLPVLGWLFAGRSVPVPSTAVPDSYSVLTVGEGV